MNSTVPWAHFDAQADQERKADFARALLRDPTRALAAARTVFGDNDLGSAIEAARDWPSDPYVKAKQKELLKEFGPDAFLPTKQDLARDVYEITRAEKVSNSEKLAAFRLYADIRGFIEKQAMNNINNTVINQNRVMVLNDHGTDEQWEEKASSSQAKLIEHVKD